ncbi:MAG: molybdate ABC transporter permease subunit [Myxococcota bacterium]
MSELLPVVALSLRVALVSVLLSLLPAIAVAYLLARRRFLGHALVDALVHLPLVLPPVVTGYALLLLFAPRGPLGDLGLAFTWRGAALASAVVAFPLFVRAARLGFDAIDPALEDAARVTGASPWRVFRTISLPLALPGVLAGALLAFGRSLGEFGATIAFAGSVPGQTDTLPLAIWQALQSPGGESRAMTLAAVSAALAFITLLAGELAARRLAWTR